MTAPPETLIVADVGNTRIKLATVVAGGPAGRLPAVAHRQDLQSRDFRAANLRDWLDRAAPGPAIVYAASVHESAATGLEAAIAEIAATGHRIVRQRRITSGHVGMPVEVDEPDRVGVDRVAAAAAAAVAKQGGRPAIVVDCGTAATVDMVDGSGAFLGGAILPGPVLMARALAEGTSKLPEVQALDGDDPPAMPGRGTRDAIAAGIGWGIRGAIAELVARARATLGAPTPVVVTGGWRRAVLPAVPDALEAPDLVLTGIALATRRVGAG